MENMETASHAHASDSANTNAKTAKRAARLSSVRFRREIVLVLLVKLALILAIKFIFFSHPASPTRVETGLDAIFSSQPLPVAQSFDPEKERP